MKLRSFMSVHLLLRWPLMLACTLACTAEGAARDRPIGLQLKWHHPFQFAAYYAAQLQGYYAYILPEVVEIGHMNRGRWEEIGRTFVEIGMAPSSRSPGGFIFDSDPPRDVRLLQWTLRAIIALAALALVILLWNIQMRRKMRAQTQAFQSEVDRREQIERELRANQNQLAAAQRIGNIGSWERDLQTDRIVWSDETYRIFGISRGDTAPAYEVSTGLVHPEDLPKRDAAHARAFRSDGITAVEYRIRRPDGQERVVHERVEIVRDEAGAPVRKLGMVMDITDRKAMEQQFLRAQRQESIGTLAGGIAHDLNNVLSPILLSIDLLRLNMRDPADLRVLDTVAMSARRGADMVRQVLSFARGSPGSRVAKAPRQLIRDIEHIIRDTFPPAVSCEVRVDDDVWPVLCDPTQLHQVLLNLCVNARDAMPDGGLLTISARNQCLDEHFVRLNGAGRAGRHVLVEVADTGSGIPEGIREKIFDPFFTTKEVGQGTGLGLSTVATIVQSHGGFVRVVSEVGRGTTFRLYLPAADDGTVTAGTEPGMNLPRGNGETILVVDDEESIRTITRQTLEAFGYRVITAENGADAIALFVQPQAGIHVVLMDMMMPIMDGLTTIRALISIDPGIRIIAASGLNAKADAARAASVGVRLFLAKPYNAETLLRTVREALKTEKPA